MKILFILKRSGIAGVETLFIRMANDLLRRQNVEVHLLLMIKGHEREFFEMLDPRIHIYESLKFRDILALRSVKIDAVYLFESLGLMWFLLLQKIINMKSLKMCLGVYHPMEYFWERNITSFLQKTLAKVVLQFHPQNIVFMNTAVLERFRSYSKQEMRGSQVLALPIDIQRFSHLDRRPIHGQFVSVGRLVDFKTYNLHTLTALRDLIAKGYNVSYEVYGSGELEPTMKEMALKYGIEKHVHFHGAIAYRELESVFQSAYCFIGCGTALVESSAAGVPSLVGVESVREPLTTGFFSESHGYDVGEYVEGAEMAPYILSMEKILKSSPDEYLLLSQDHKKRALAFDIQTYGDRFIQILKEAEKTDIKISSLKIIFWFVQYFTLKLAAKMGFKNTLFNRYVENGKS